MTVNINEQLGKIVLRLSAPKIICFVLLLLASSEKLVNNSVIDFILFILFSSL